MMFYHGTDRKFGTIDLGKSRLRTDFGRGFYLSDKLGNARAWAEDKSGVWGVPTVIRCDVNDAVFSNTDMQRLRFDKPTLEWLDFVRDNRRRDVQGVNLHEPRHSYDVVSGPIANDKVAIAVDKYCRGKQTAEETLNEVRAIREVFQVSLHTPLALSFIKKMTYSQRVSGRWSGWLEF
jgi:hypothetical protein